MSLQPTNYESLRVKANTALLKLQARLRAQQNRIEKISELIKKLNEQAEVIADELSLLIAASSNSTVESARDSRPVADCPAGGKRRIRPHLANLIKDPVIGREARAGVSSVVLRENHDGSFEVCIDGGSPARLSPQAGRLLKAITGPIPGQGEESPPSWKPRAQVLEEMKIDACRPSAGKLLNQIVYRLRNELYRSGINPHFVQVHKDLGLRFVLRHAEPAACGEEPSDTPGAENQARLD